MPFTRLLVLALICIASWDCTSPSPSSVRVDGPRRPDNPLRELQRQFRSSRELTIVYHEADKALMAAAKTQMDQRFRRFTEIRWVSDMALHPTDLTGKSVMLIGDSQHHLLEMLAEKLPFQTAPGQLRFHGQTFDDPSDVLAMWYPSPVDPEMPIMLAVGNQAEAAYGYLYAVLRNPEITVYRRGKIILEGAFDFDDQGHWTLNDQGWHSLLDQTKVVVETPQFRVFNYQMAADQDQLNALKSGWQQQWSTLETFLGQKVVVDTPIDIYLYKRFASKARFFAGNDAPTRYGNAAVRHISHRYHEMHLALEPEIDPLGPAYLVALLAGETLGVPKTAALETGLASFLAPNWGGQSASYWAARQTRAGWAPSLDMLVHATQETEALALRYQPYTAAMAGFLHQLWGGAGFAANYATWEPTSKECAVLEPQWQAFLKQQADAMLSKETGPSKKQLPFPNYPRGANHTFEGFSVDRGYLGVRSDAALTHLAELGANAVALVPYVRALKDQPQALLPLLGANKENDASVIHAASQAKSLGMAVLLKPQLEGVWPGHIDMGNEAKWEAFFDHYRQMIRHYAMMAEIHELPALCVGVEMVEASRHESFWRDLASELRKLYSGKLVYAANWGEEFERVGFWDAYDAIGLDCYYPLGASTNPTDNALLEQAGRVIAKIDAIGDHYGMPVWLTEVGYASVQQAWLEPYRDRGRTADGGEAQVRCYRALMTAMAQSKRIRGAWWWKWHSDGRTGPGDRSFSAQDKPAEALLGAWLTTPDDPGAFGN